MKLQAELTLRIWLDANNLKCTDKQIKALAQTLHFMAITYARDKPSKRRLWNED